jgi:glutamine amidotransferase
MPGKTVIINCGEGNVNSVQKMMARINNDTSVTSSPAEIEKADRIILPGIGHFQKAMEALNRLGLLEPLNEAVLNRKTPILGICLGMQLMSRSSEEGNTKGLGWIEGEVVRFREDLKIKVPHMGWNTISIRKQSRLMYDVEEGTAFYFAHAFHWKSNDPATILCETDYGVSFPSAIEKENIFGVQFHPEKSHDDGLQLLRNFAAI